MSFTDQKTRRGHNPFKDDRDSVTNLGVKSIEIDQTVEKEAANRLMFVNTSIIQGTFSV
jgi:hypothetical protein